jgi:hypothetical protein
MSDDVSDDIGDFLSDDSHKYMPDEVTSDSTEDNHMPQMKIEINNFQLQQRVICHSKDISSTLEPSCFYRLRNISEDN